MEETIYMIGKTASDTAVDMANKSESFFSQFSKEALLLLLLAVILGVYFVVNAMKKAKQSVNARKNTLDKRFMKEFTELNLESFLRRLTGPNREFFYAGAKDYLEKNNLALSKESVKEMFFDLMKKYNKDEKVRKMYLKGENADMFLDAIYKSLQLGLKTGPEYEKLQAKMKKTFKEQMKKQNIDFDEKAFDFEKMSENFAGADDFAFHQEFQMQQMQMMDMQNMQMVEQMNMQMMQQMEQMNLQMMEQMNMQMMEQMNQMNQQMMDQMNMQMMDQMNQQMSMNLDSMNMANQAMTSTDFGGFMDHNANSGNFGPF